MKRHLIIKEIQDALEKIKVVSGIDSDSFLSEVSHLYEMAILLKHNQETKINDEKTNNTPSEEIGIQKIENKTQDVSQNPIIVSQPSIDLFSSEEIPLPEKTPTVAIKKEIQKAAQKKEIKKSVAENLQHNKIADLKAAIGINEKFQFINELFQGNMKEYNVAIDQFNSFSSFSEADSYLTNLKELYKWDSENTFVANFKELLQRRFSS